MSEADIQQWLPAAKALLPSQIKQIDLPKAIFLAESLDVANLATTYWVSVGGAPALSNNGNRFTGQIIIDIKSLWAASLEADAQWVITVDPKSPVSVHGGNEKT